MRRWLVLLVLLAGLACVHRDATIVVNSRPSGASIWLDGDSTGFVTPHTFTGLYAGFHWLKLGFAGCSWEDTFSLNPKETRTLDKELARRLWTTGNIGVCCSPAVAPDGTIYVVTYDYRLLALDWSGDTLRSRRLPFNDACALAIGEDGRIYVKSGSMLLVLSPQGESLWSCTTADGGGIALGQNGVVYSSGGSWLNANDRQGVALWSRQTGSSWQPSPPVVGADGMVYVTNSGKLYAVDSAGAIRWTCSLEYDLGNPLAIGPDGTIYVACYRLTAVGRSGTARWASAQYYPTGPAVGPDGTVYASTVDTIYAANPDGTPRWDAYLDGYSNRMTPVVSADERVYVAGISPSLVAFETGGRPLWQVLGGSGSYHNPALVDSTLLVVDSDSRLTAYRVSGAGPAQGWPMFQHDARRSGRAE
jgi:hypothetical protein